MPFVLDSSVALSWLLPDETAPAVDELAERLAEAPALVPAIWYLEVGNALLMAQRRDRITEKELEKLLSVVVALPLETDSPHIEEALAPVMRLAREQKLTAYDASYLELAYRRSRALASLDSRLREAAGKLGIQVLP
jgi:predicted nucleic acid-binding protein